MLGFAAFHSAQRFCRAFEEIRQYFRPRRKQNQIISLAQRRRRFVARAQALESMFLAAAITNRNIFSRHARMLWLTMPPVLTLSCSDARL
jgi:hypothetical protein